MIRQLIFPTGRPRLRLGSVIALGVAGCGLGTYPLSAQSIENFDTLSAPGNRYGDGSFVGAQGIVWHYGQARTVTATFNIEGPSLGPVAEERATRLLPA
jgi:hypothetical protein